MGICSSQEVKDKRNKYQEKGPNQEDISAIQMEDQRMLDEQIVIRPKVEQNAIIIENQRISDQSIVKGPYQEEKNAIIIENQRISDQSIVKGPYQVEQSASIMKDQRKRDDQIFIRPKVEKNAIIIENQRISDQSIVKGPIQEDQSAIIIEVQRRADKSILKGPTLEKNSPITMEDYKMKVTNTNISNYVQQYATLKAWAEMEATILCTLSKEKIKIPIRHTGFININCVFELEVWFEFLQSKSLEDVTQCPSCLVNVKYTDYGVDYVLCNAIAMLYHVDPQGKRFRRDKLVTMYSKNKFYAVSKQDPTIKTLLPGCSAILNVQRRQQLSAQVQINKNNAHIYEEISQTIEKFEQYLKQKKYRALMSNKNLELKDVNQKLQSKVKDIKQVILQNCKLLEIGRQSISANDFVFALKKRKLIDLTCSILIVYYPHYNIWIDFELFDSNGKPYLQQEQALYIKNSTQPDFNIIYILGGKTAQFEQSAQFMQIEIPKDPYTQLTQLNLKKLPDLLQIGYNYLGTFYENKIFIFYGQKRYINENQCIADKMLNVAQVFSNQNWSNLNVQPSPRFDGSCFVITHPVQGKCIVFYGGLPDQPEGLPNCACSIQTQGQIFVCAQQTFLGNAENLFELRFPQIVDKSRQNRVVCSPIFSIPYYKQKQLLVSGNYLKENLNGKRQIYTFDWGEGEVKLNEIFSLEPPEQILTPYQNRGNAGLETFTPVQDCEGCLVYGNFYTIHQFEEQAAHKQKRTITQVLKINLTNLFFKILPYKDRANSQEENQAIMSNLKNQENVMMNINV